MAAILPRRAPDQVVAATRDPIPAAVLDGASDLIATVRRDGEKALRDCAQRFDDLPPDAPLTLDRSTLQRDLEQLPTEQRDLLHRCSERVRDFAQAQKDCLRELDRAMPGGRAGHDIRPLDRAGCYAPGGRYPLPSSVLMTAVTARVAGVGEVWVASPRPTAVTRAAAAVAGADGLLCAGGAHAVAALAYGAGSVPACQAVVGPGNLWVTAAKQLVSGDTRIDMLAGPTELVVIADRHADPALVAADLLAQAEHDDHARSILISDDTSLLDATDAELARQLDTLRTRKTAATAMASGAAVHVADLGAAIDLSDQLAPEHLQIHCVDELPRPPRDYGGLFLGSGAAEVLGDYCAGPNHVLPTGGSARHKGGLSVFDFLRIRTWMRVDDAGAAADLARDAAALAALEGLHGHQRAAELRGESSSPGAMGR